MSGFIAKVQALALTLGAPGLLFVAFLDSSFLSLPEITDLLVVWMVMQNKSLVFVYAAAATIGSMAGCLLMYYIGKKGGDAVLRKRFRGPVIERAMRSVRRYGVLAIVIPSLLPPPAPFKIFVLMAGVVDMGRARFIASVAVGRGARYLIEGLLAVWYGEQAIEFVRTHGRTVSYGLVIAVVAALAGYVVWMAASTMRARNHVE